MLQFPADKSIEVGGVVFNYTVPTKSFGRVEVERQAKTTKLPALVYSEFIDSSDVAHAIAREEGKRVETCVDQKSRQVWAYKVV